NDDIRQSVYQRHNIKEITEEEEQQIQVIIENQYQTTESEMEYEKDKQIVIQESDNEEELPFYTKQGNSSKPFRTFNTETTSFGKLFGLIPNKFNINISPFRQSKPLTEFEKTEIEEFEIFEEPWINKPLEIKSPSIKPKEKTPVKDINTKKKMTDIVEAERLNKDAQDDIDKWNNQSFELIRASIGTIPIFDG
ncbi:17584_t:CDS:1, partial [Acaulospora colombiana]